MNKIYGFLFCLNNYNCSYSSISIIAVSIEPSPRASCDMQETRLNLAVASYLVLMYIV